jgi:hypothetical protein
MPRVETHNLNSTHSDICVVGKNALIVHGFERPVNVIGFDKKVANVKAQTVTADVAYDPVSGQIFFYGTSGDLHPDDGTQPALLDADAVERCHGIVPRRTTIRKTLTLSQYAKWIRRSRT